MASKAVAAVSRIAKEATKEASKFFKLPWKITGPASSPEFLQSLVQAGTFREICPASYPRRVLVPQALPENVYRIAYYPRELRRADIVITHEKVSAVERPSDSEGEAVESGEQSTKTAPPLPPAAGGYYVMGKEYHINDTPGDGYTR